MFVHFLYQIQIKQQTGSYRNAQAENVEKDFEDVLDMTPTEFCDGCFTLSGILRNLPGGRYLLRCGIYCQLSGRIQEQHFFTNPITCIILYYNSVELATNRITYVIYLQQLVLLSFCYLIIFGSIAEHDCGTTEKSAQLVNNGKILLVTAVIFDIVATLYL